MRRIIFTLLLAVVLSIGQITHSAWADEFVFACFPDGQSHSDICMINSDGSNLRRLTESPKSKAWPTWSPDKKTIVFGHVNKLWLMDADGNNLRVLREDVSFDLRTAWSPDGSKIAYGVVFAINIDEGIGLRQLTQHPGEDRTPAWSPDGKHIAFYSTRNETGGIFLMDADGNNITELTNDGENTPSWSPDGKQIAVDVFPGPPQIGAEGIAVGPIPGKPHIRVMDADGRNSEFITVGHSPSWQSTFPSLAVQPVEMLTLTWGQIKSD